MLVLLDRDGVINRDAKTGILSVAEFHFLPGVLPAIARLNEAGFRIAICTNQSAVGRNLITQKTLDDIHAHMMAHIRAAGGNVEKIYVATDTPEAATHRRKPGPGMLEEALRDFAVKAHRTPMVGDMLRDLEAAASAGCPRILVHSGNGAQTAASGIPAHIEPVIQLADLPAAVEYIIAHYAGT